MYHMHKSQSEIAEFQALAFSGGLSVARFRRERYKSREEKENPEWSGKPDWLWL